MTNDEIRNKMRDKCDDLGWDAERGEEEFWGRVGENGASQLRDDGGANQRVYDLEERTAKFGEAIIQFAKKIPFNPVNNRLIDQLVGAGTSVGANYCEANDGISRKDFKYQIGICRKEAQETRFFFANDRQCRIRIEKRSTRALAGS